MTLAPGLLYEDRNGTLWVGAGELSTLNPGGGVTTRFTPPHGDPANSPRVAINALHGDADGFLWFGTTARRQQVEMSQPVLYRFNIRTGKASPYTMGSRITGGRPGGILRKDLAGAILSLDTALIASVIERVSKYDAALG